MLGIVPAAGCGSRIQPLGCSKELLPVGTVVSAGGVPKPKAVSEYLVERMLKAGVDRICFVIGREKTDILRYYADSPYSDRIFYVLQSKPRGLCDAVFQAIAHARADEQILIGLPDTIWFPQNAYCLVPRETVHLITFPVEQPQHFDAVLWNGQGTVEEVQVKQAGALDRRVWGAITMPGSELFALHQLWRERDCRDEFLGHLFNVWLAGGHVITADCTGTDYLDVGTLEGFHRALNSLARPAPPAVVAA